MSELKISVSGLGYIGLPTATMFANYGAHVIGLDVNQYAIDTINEGKIHIVEPGLEEIVKKVVSSGHLKASLQAEKADAFLIAVPTPFKGEDHTPDLSYIEAAVNTIAPVLEKGNVVILESTSPVGATEQMVEWLSVLRPDLKFPKQATDTDVDVHVAYCPERVLPGHVIRELVENNRTIGGMTTACTQKAKDVYQIFVRGELLETNARTAEMTKLTENAFRDVNIAFANELSLICDRLDIDVWELIKLANHHPRVNILRPGAGVGGHCIAVDPWFIVNKTPDLAKMVRSAREVNDYKPQWVIQQIENEVQKLGNLGRKPSVALLGLAFKPDIDDLRESPAVEIAKEFGQNNDVELFLVEPHIQKLPTEITNGRLVDLEEAIQQADVNVILVDHSNFMGLNKNYADKRILNFVATV
ncbi:UDP-N-acetyl-D-mannosaminuronic acid dehydrogenase [Acinetobacter sp. Ac_3412]|uniref:UDP-N-acetyl-D-mannosamine dehydrogenase n=1 Tax=Acinetobacter TaxID=469 RepID=UPI00148F8006|nr:MULTISPECIES: UDP-N-acetyl-D-mannosamine dehydrogenase [Acinetobacter]MDO3666229.1 UDP-N-acetyl-D-mannosamine dehydrogenase [Acinetobacter higginsii]NNP75042.1 UDP-N-acetyl-D-mannosaminuronic acid dehydrogenase [Acinetobacter sp. Ac_3412]